MVVINRLLPFSLLLSLWSTGASAAVIPEDRADVLFHSYSGGGVTIDGPSFLVRKGFKDKVSVYANYYQDYISGASIDVIVSGGSKYTEERTEYSVGVDYLLDSTLLSIGGGNSTEDDYIADSVHVGLSQDFFGDMTTLTMGYAYGEDTIMRNGTVLDGEEAFLEYSDHRRFSLGVTQVLTKKLIMGLSVESVVDGGFLNNPYRDHHSVSREGTKRDKDAERYPLTHNSDAISIRSMYYLPYRAALKFEARIFSDSWGVEARNFELRYIHPIREQTTVELKLRTYSQTQADFYSDLFIYDDAADFLARDKELSTYTSTSLGLGVTYDFKYKFPFADKQNINFYWDFFTFDYDNFLDACYTQKCLGRKEPTGSVKIGEEPTYAFQANVIRMFFSVYY